jgi:hypothetical protein
MGVVQETEATLLEDTESLFILFVGLNGSDESNKKL